ncbi:MAG TPA: TonB-dependent receptor [Bryobacteraceae bacterium]|jgi:hypothetical protein|nr:TonB-dependent receptor [Bryobacteraceae bacterium]
MKYKETLLGVTNSKQNFRHWWPVVIAALMLTPLGFSQETTGGIQGMVKDPSGSAIPNATLELSGTTLLGNKQTTSDAAGSYHFTELPSGVYTLTTSATGFKSFKLVGLDVTAGRLPNVDVKLEIGTVSETVEVTSDIPTVDVTQSKVAITVDRQVLDSIPVGRSFQSVIPFAAGARQEPMQGTTSNRQNGFQIDGASDSENVYLVDGVNTTNIQTGGVGRNFQMEFIQEVQIKSSSFEAEFGGALGGVINAVPKRGGNTWHGSLFSYFQTSSLDANDACSSGLTSGSANVNVAGFSTTCGLRLDPTKPSLNTSTRLDGTPQYYVPAKDQRLILEPGYSIGGAIIKDRLWIFSAYAPAIDTLRRLTTFTGANPGPRTLTQSSTSHNAFNRLDYRLNDKIRLFASWNYAYYRATGQLGQPDSLSNQLNAGASTDPNTLRADSGNVNPNSVYSFGGDWTPTSKFTVSARYGYFFNNNEQRGTPIGTRYVYQTTANASSKDLAGNPFPASSFNTAGFANIPNNLATVYDAYNRSSVNVDGSYFVARLFGGSHNFKAGFFQQTQQNNVLTNFQGGRVDLYFGQSYTPVTSTTACNGVIATNQSLYGSSACEGKYGYFVVGTGVTNTGGTEQYAHAVYLQDAWNVGHGLTLNLGLRLDQERQPPYDANRFPTVEFGFGDKIAPRIGGAYDVLHNGKLKLYASYGKFYDIMKMGLARGSFGSDYWHNCVYAMDDTNYAAITPSLQTGGGCPASGPAPGVTVGRFIENVDFRATKADTRDPAIDPNLKPMLQHEYVAGADWAITPDYTLETRYARKRLDRTIEDSAITDNLGFYIGNPGTTFDDFLHRPVVIPDASGNNYLTTVPFCAECPAVVPATRRYDGVEFRLSRRPTGKLFGTLSYTYSRLTGNYSGLTNTDDTDGGGGRHAPNNGRAFDIPTMEYTPSGAIDDGPLSTDRPNTGKAFGYYRLKWMGGETLFGMSQSAFQGTPISSCLSVVGTSSACQWAEGRGNFVQLSRAANGDIVKGDVVHNARTDNYFQTDLSIHHEVRTSENTRLIFEINAINALNQHSVLAVNELIIAGSGLISPTRASRFSGDPGVDWGKVMNGYNYIDALNGKGAFAGVQAPVTLSNRYGLPQVYQAARNLRLSVRFTF